MKVSYCDKCGIELDTAQKSKFYAVACDSVVGVRVKHNDNPADLCAVCFLTAIERFMERGRTRLATFENREEATA